MGAGAAQEAAKAEERERAALREAQLAREHHERAREIDPDATPDDEGDLRSSAGVGQADGGSDTAERIVN
jgi:hypothetical protein